MAILVTVEEAAEHLQLHPKTVLRYIRSQRLPATRVGKSYRIVRADLDVFSGAANRHFAMGPQVRTTCVVDIENLTAEHAAQIAAFVSSAAISRGSSTTPLHLSTTFDSTTDRMKVIAIGNPVDAAKLLELLQFKLDASA